MEYLGGPFRAKPFLRRERRMEVPCELHGGYACTLDRSSNRQRIASNVNEHLRDVALARFPDLYVGCRRILPSRDCLFYPDLTLVEGPVEFLDELRDVVLNPKVVVHVTSGSREFFDRRGRIDSYEELDSLAEIILISEDRVTIETYRRQAGGSWFQGVLSSIRHRLRIRALDIEVPLKTIYDGVDFRPAR